MIKRLAVPKITSATNADYYELIGRDRHIKNTHTWSVLLSLATLLTFKTLGFANDFNSTIYVQFAVNKLHHSEA